MLARNVWGNLRDENPGRNEMLNWKVGGGIKDISLITLKIWEINENYIKLYTISQMGWNHMKPLTGSVFNLNFNITVSRVSTFTGAIGRASKEGCESLDRGMKISGMFLVDSVGSFFCLFSWWWFTISISPLNHHLFFPTTLSKSKTLKLTTSLPVKNGGKGKRSFQDGLLLRAKCWLQGGLYKTTAQHSRDVFKLFHNIIWRSPDVQNPGGCMLLIYILPASSKWPFDLPNGGHLAPEKVT